MDSSIGTIEPSTFLGHFGPDIYVPSYVTLTQADNTYKPLPVHVAIQQYFHPVLHCTERKFAFLRAVQVCPVEDESRALAEVLHRLQGRACFPCRHRVHQAALFED